MKHLLFLLSLFLLVLMTRAQDTTCTPSIQFRYDENAKIFSLVNSDGAILQSYPGIYNHIRQPYSPDCRFIMATLRRDADQTTSLNRDTLVWNANTGEQLQVFEGTLGRLYSVYWSPDSERLILSTRNGHFLWNFYTDDLVQMTQLDGWWLELYWDIERQEVFALPYTLYYSSGEVLVYNWISGEHVASYTSYLNRDHYSTSESTFAVRGDWVIVAMYSTGHNTPITIWDRNTQQLISQLNGEALGIIPSYHPAGTPDLVDVSPDRHYLVVVDWNLRVWDMNNLAETYEDRTANYQYHLDNNAAEAVHFIDNTTVEILLDDNITLIRMNILTGEILE